jgi:mannose-6-phosphate isomerase
MKSSDNQARTTGQPEGHSPKGAVPTPPYPLVFKPVYKQYLWGGRGLEKLGRRLPDGIVAESWEISAHPDGLGQVANGPLAGETLPGLMQQYGARLLGDALPAAAYETFPLLVKLIDANDRLSVQVHPDDAYAALHEHGGLGKTEMWVVLDAEPGARLIHGLAPGVTREQFARAVRTGDVMPLLREVPARRGDVFDIPAGLVHAVGAGLLIAEIQQSSNTTYRVFDYQRKDAAGNLRDLHVDKALDVIRFGPQPEPVTALRPVRSSSGTERTILVRNKYFVVERLEIPEREDAVADGSRFHLLMGIEGSAVLSWEQGELPLRRGASVFIPAQLGPYRITGSCTAIRAWVP